MDPVLQAKLLQHQCIGNEDVAAQRECQAILRIQAEASAHRSILGYCMVHADNFMKPLCCALQDPLCCICKHQLGVLNLPRKKILTLQLVIMADVLAGYTGAANASTVC